MKLTLSFIFTLMIPLSYADDYVPDENHITPDEIQRQEERVQKQEERREIKKARKIQEENERAKVERYQKGVDDPRFDKFDQEMIKNRDGSY